MKRNLTTICYIEKEGCYLMLHRVKKEHDINRDKWIGVGGHFEAQEDCLLREVREETGLILNAWKLRGVISFIYGGNDGEYMFVYTADSFTGTLTDCDEGELEWVEKAKVYELPLWEGDRIFLRLLETERPFFSLKLLYEGDKLLEAVLDGRKL